MWNLEKAILVTNNDKVYTKYKDELQCIFVEKYEVYQLKIKSKL